MFFLLRFGNTRFFETSFQIAQRLQAMAFIFANPALGDLVQRHWIEVMELFAPAPHRGHEAGRFQHGNVLGHRLAGHVEVRAQLAQRLPVAGEQLVQQPAARAIGQGFENRVHCGNNMQPKGCMSSPAQKYFSPRRKTAPPGQIPA